MIHTGILKAKHTRRLSACLRDLYPSILLWQITFSMNSSTSMPPVCRNCGTNLQGPYCAQCGQRDLDFRRDWRDLMAEVATQFLNFDGKLARGVVDLCFRPGQMTRLFLSGKRATQIPPLRFYVFVSLLFFLWLGLNARIGFDQEQEMLISLEEKFPRLDTVMATFMNWLPYAFLVGVPVMAGFTRLLFLRRGRVYLEHLVIVLHLQTFVMLWLIVRGGWMELFSLASTWAGELVEILAVGWLLLYPLFAIRRIFELKWWTSALYAGALELAYVVYLLSVFIGLVLLAVLIS